MHATLSRSLALLISMLALTTSFSLSSLGIHEQNNAKKDEIMSTTNVPRPVISINNNSNRSRDKTYSKPFPDKAPWVFEYAWGDNLTQLERFENSLYVPNTHYNFMIDLEPKLDKHSISKKKLYAAFRTYKMRKTEEIIGIIFKDENNEGKLMLYDNEGDKLEPLSNSYARLIKNRKVDLSTPDKGPIYFHCNESCKCIFYVRWKEYKDHEYIKVSYDTKGKIQIADFINSEKMNLIETLTRLHSASNDARKINALPQNKNNTKSPPCQTRKVTSKKARNSNIHHKTSTDQKSMGARSANINFKKKKENISNSQKNNASLSNNAPLAIIAVVSFVLIVLAICIVKVTSPKRASKSNKDAR